MFFIVCLPFHVRVYLQTAHGDIYLPLNSSFSTFRLAILFFSFRISFLEDVSKYVDDHSKDRRRGEGGIFLSCLHEGSIYFKTERRSGTVGLYVEL